MSSKKLPPISPGEILRTELIEPNNIGIPELARKINVPSGRLYDILNEKRAITADTDLRLCKFFGISSGFFLRLQIRYDIESLEDKMEDELKKIEPMEV